MKIEQNRFLKNKALDFFMNFIQRCKRDVKDEDFFGLIEPHLDRVSVARALRAALPLSDVPDIDDDDAEMNSLQRLRRGYTPDSIREMLKESWNNTRFRGVVRKVILDFEPRLRKALGAPGKRQDAFTRRFDELIKLFKLSKIEADILLLRFLHRESILEQPFRMSRNGSLELIETIAMWLARPWAEIVKSLSTDQKLRRYECLDNDFDLNEKLAVFLHGLSKEPLANSYYQSVKGEVLPWDFYGDLSRRHGGMLQELIRKRDRQRGLHILLYGAPGTGKTCFAHSLATELNMTCYDITQNIRSEDNGSCQAKPEHRFGALEVCESQIDSAGSILVIDEADEMLRGSFGGGFFAMFGGRESQAGDKGLLNSVMDKVKSTCIWITNTSARELDPSSRRRFDYSIHFDKLNTGQRRAIWRNNVTKLKLDKLFPPELQERLAAKYEVSAGGITLVLRNLASLKPTVAGCEKLVEQLMEPHCGLMEIKKQDDKLLPAADYSLDGLNIKGAIPLERIVGAVRKFQSETGRADAGGSPDRPRMNLLLCGPPGTGKTEFVKHLGAVLDTKIVVRMGSDLLSMWVGGTEQNIKSAFAEAETEKAILFLDEIDGLVQSRERATRSWEVTQVNELLHQMENFNGVLVGATNFMTNLDAATLRRFTFKLEFDYLESDGKRLFFERMFNTRLDAAAAARLEAIPKLAPGDFRTVRQSLHYLADNPTDQDRLAALEHESEMKDPAERNSQIRIGFR